MRGSLRHGETTLPEYSVTKAGSRDVLGYPAVYRINVIIYAACVAACLPRDIRGHYHPRHYFDCDYHYGAIMISFLFIAVAVSLFSRYFRCPHRLFPAVPFHRFAARFPSLSDYTELVSR